MVEISKERKKSIGDGILMPLLQNRFKVWFDNREFTQEGKEILTSQVIRCSVNFKEQKFEVWLEQPLLLPTFATELVKTLVMAYNTQIALYSCDGEDNKNVFLTLSCQCTDHVLELDYAKNETVKHKLIFKIHSVR